MSPCTPDQVLTRSPRLSWRVLDGEVVILHPEAGTLHRLNDTGTAVWELLDGARDLNTIAATLAEDFDVAPDLAAAELTHLADDLVEAGLVEVNVGVAS